MAPWRVGCKDGDMGFTDHPHVFCSKCCHLNLWSVSPPMVGISFGAIIKFPFGAIIIFVIHVNSTDVFLTELNLVASTIFHMMIGCFHSK